MNEWWNERVSDWLDGKIWTKVCCHEPCVRACRHMWSQPCRCSVWMPWMLRSSWRCIRGWCHLESLAACWMSSPQVNIHSFTHSFTHSFIHPSIHSSIHSFIHPSIHSFIHSLIHSFIRSFIRSFIHSFIHPFIHSFVHSFIHSSIHYSIECMSSPRVSYGQSCIAHCISVAPSYTVTLLHCIWAIQRRGPPGTVSDSANACWKDKPRSNTGLHHLSAEAHQTKLLCLFSRWYRLMRTCSLYCLTCLHQKQV